VRLLGSYLINLQYMRLLEEEERFDERNDFDLSFVTNAMDFVRLDNPPAKRLQRFKETYEASLPMINLQVPRTCKLSNATGTSYEVAHENAQRHRQLSCHGRRHR
jgi:hypothetical protein